MVPPNSGGGAVLPAHCPFLLFGFHLAFMNTLAWPFIGTAHFTTTHLSSFQSQTFTRKRRIVSIPLATGFPSKPKACNRNHPLILLQATVSGYLRHLSKASTVLLLRLMVSSNLMMAITSGHAVRRILDPQW